MTFHLYVPALEFQGALPGGLNYLPSPEENQGLAPTGMSYVGGATVGEIS